MAGTLTALAAAFLVLWLRAEPRVVQALARVGLNVGTAAESATPHQATFGVPYQIRGQSFGGGVTETVRRRFVARAGQALVLEYDVAVERGRVRLYVHGFPLIRDALWEQTLEADGRETVRVRVPRTGPYECVIDRHRHAGSYHLEWRLE